jgi:antitoxin component of MazEF toxin-antitoxin module
MKVPMSSDPGEGEMTIAIREKIQQDGVLRLSQEIWQYLRLETGAEVELRVEEGRLIVTPIVERKRLRLAPDIVDELVANEELYLPEGG